MNKDIVVGEGKNKRRYKPISNGWAKVDEQGNEHSTTLDEVKLIERVRNLECQAFEPIWGYLKNKKVDFANQVVKLKEDAPDGQDDKLILTLIDTLFTHNDQMRAHLASQAVKEHQSQKRIIT